MDLKKYKHVIWDWNGTLLDDASLCVQILNETISKRNFAEVTLERYQDEFVFPVKDYYESLGFDFSKEDFETVATDYCIVYGERSYECQLQEKAIDVLKAFRSIGVNQSILSAYHNEPLRKIIEHFGLSGYFVQMVGLNDYCAKSKVDIGRSLIAKIGIDPEEILFIGDTIHDFEVGCEIGVDCALIPCGHNSKKRLKACGTEVIDNLSHLLDAIKAIS